MVTIPGFIKEIKENGVSKTDVRTLERTYPNLVTSTISLEYLTDVKSNNMVEEITVILESIPTTEININSLLLRLDVLNNTFKEKLFPKHGETRTTLNSELFLKYDEHNNLINSLDASIQTLIEEDTETFLMLFPNGFRGVERAILHDTNIALIDYFNTMYGINTCSSMLDRLTYVNLTTCYKRIRERPLALIEQLIKVNGKTDLAIFEAQVITLENIYKDTTSEIIIANLFR